MQKHKLLVLMVLVIVDISATNSTWYCLAFPSFPEGFLVDISQYMCVVIMRYCNGCVFYKMYVTSVSLQRRQRIPELDKILKYLSNMQLSSPEA